MKRVTQLLCAGLCLAALNTNALAAGSVEKHSTQRPACGVLRLPRSFNIEEKFFTLGTNFKVIANSAQIGTIEQKVFSWGKAFRLIDSDKRLVAVATQRLFSWGVQIDITDCNKNKLGSVREDITKSLITTWTTYSILDHRNQLVAQSDKVEFVNTDISMFDSRGRAVGRIHRVFFNLFGDSWTVAMGNNFVDPRLYIFIAALKSSSDNDKSSD